MNGCHQKERHLNNPHQSSPSINFLCNKKLHVCNFKNPYCISFSSDNLSRMNQERNMHRSRTIYEKKTVLNKYDGEVLMKEDKRGWTFLLEEALLWIIYILARNNNLNVKLVDGFVSHKLSFSFHKTLTDGLEFMDYMWILWCFYQCLGSHSDDTHSLQRIHWWASDVMLHLFFSNKSHFNATLKSYCYSPNFEV